jgi:hypothetical protein
VAEKQDVREDIKGKRESHLSSPVGNDTEFHLRLAGLTASPQVGKYYTVCFNTMCTSKGEDSGVEMARFVQMGKPDVLEAPNQKLKQVSKRMFGAKDKSA